MNEIISTSSAALLSLPALPITVRAGTLDDVAFMDGLQKKHTKQVGWMPTKTLEGKVALGHVLVAIDEPGERVGYCIGNDQYFKHDDVGIIYQMNVVPGRQRGLVGATLLKAQFERSAYGCRLYCCWCAQDIAANRFWEAMGFVPLAFRTGSPTKGAKGTPRIHIFWQKRIRAGDVSTPWWFPSQTTGGSIREDRLVLPIPPGTHWSDAKPIVLPGMTPGAPMLSDEQASGATGRRTRRPVSSAHASDSHRSRRTATCGTQTSPPSPATISRTLVGGLRFGMPKPIAPVAEKAAEKKPREPRAKQKNDPTLVAAARELRDRWLEQVNASPIHAIAGKYDVTVESARTRAIAGDVTVDALSSASTPLALPSPMKLLDAA